MHLGRGRCCESDENDHSIAARIPADGVDVKIGFPVIDGPDVAGLIDDHGGLTHHRYETGERAWSVQRISIVQKHLLTCGGHGVNP